MTDSRTVCTAPASGKRRRDLTLSIDAPFPSGGAGCFEQDQRPSFTTPDEEGKIILDYCFLSRNKRD